MRSYARAILSILACYGAGFLGSFFIDGSVGSWYDALEKPWFTPPNWIFFPVWMILYGFMAAALYLVWQKDKHANDFRGWVPLFLAHLLANLAWIILFFGFHAIFLAFIDILILTTIAFLLLCGAWEIDRRASYLLAPYLAWLLYALALNVAIWHLN